MNNKMNNNLINLVIILDRSGSMSIIWTDMIGGLKAFIEEQKEFANKNNKNIKITFVIFDDQYEIICDYISVNEFEFEENKYMPRGMTALLDAVGKTINKIGESLNKKLENEKPGKNLIVIITDGEENSSIEFKKEQIKRMIEHQKEKYNWDFVFLGANQDSFAEAGGLGINKNSTMNYQANSRGIKMAFGSISNYAKSYCQDKDYDLSEDSQEVK